MKLNKRSRWIIVVTVLAVLSVLSQVDSVQATFSDMHMFAVMLRVESEIMQKTPAGQYYDSLFWKHSEELMQLIDANPGKYEELVRVNRLFVPGLEALLDGKGDEVRVTPEQVEGLKVQLDWFASMGSPALLEDIQKEQRRLPLDHFVGMTMNETWDYINSKWTPDMVVEQTLTHLSVAQTDTPVPMEALTTPQNLVPGSDEKWAYYVDNQIYFEYPSSYQFRTTESNIKFINLIPSTGVFGHGNLGEITVQIWNVSVEGKDRLHLTYWYPEESIVWESIIQNAEFEGIEFISGWPGASIMYLGMIGYNQDNQLGVRVEMYETPVIPDGFDYSALINQKYEYFQHIVDSLRTQEP